MAVALRANALTLLDTVKVERLGLSGSASDDLISRLINVASNRIEQFLGHKLGKATLTESIVGRGTQFLFIERTPLLSITSITVDGEVVESTDFVIEQKDEGRIRRLDKVWLQTGRIGPGIRASKIHGSEDRLIVVVYTGGFVLPATQPAVAPDEDLPAEIEEACIEEVVTGFRRKGTDKSIKSEKVLSGSQTFFTSSELGGSGLNPVVESMLQPYVRQFG